LHLAHTYNIVGTLLPIVH